MTILLERQGRDVQLDAVLDRAVYSAVVAVAGAGRGRTAGAFTMLGQFEGSIEGPDRCMAGSLEGNPLLWQINADRSGTTG